MKPITVLSLFDGISCGQVALERAGIPVNTYYASEIDKNAIKITQKNYPNTIQIGDVTKIDFKQFEGKIDLLIGGSPCQDLSIAGKRKGLAGERSRLFYKYVEALQTIKPKYFLLENNVGMPNETYEEISRLIGCYPVMINSALVSAQSRKRYYWTNIGEKEYDLFGFPTCAIAQPKNKKILFKDIQETNVYDEFNVSSYRQENFRRKTTGNAGVIGTVAPKNSNFTQRHEVFGTDGKIACLLSSDYKGPKIVLDAGRLRYITPLECERLQTVPDRYTEDVSKTQRYKALGNGWTVDIIAHIFSFLKEELK